MLDFLPTEIIAAILHQSNSIGDALALASSCSRIRAVFASSQRLTILAEAADAQYGPSHDAIQLATHNASQPAHCVRRPPCSLALLQQIVQLGRVADAWADLYPMSKWKTNSEQRRCLDPRERRCFRRALYRLWLYGRAFHTAAYPRELRLRRTVMAERSALLHNWTTDELGEIADVHAVLRELIRTKLCPSDGAVARKLRKRELCSDGRVSGLGAAANHAFLPACSLGAPSGHQSMLPCTAAVVKTPTTGTFQTKSIDSRYSSRRADYVEGWGDEVQHYYVVQDVLKLAPDQLLTLLQQRPRKAELERVLHDLGDWFGNNGETWQATLELVLQQRGHELDDFVHRVAAGELGVAIG